MIKNNLKHLFLIIALTAGFSITASAQKDQRPPKEKPPVIVPGEKKPKDDKPKGDKKPNGEFIIYTEEQFSE